MLSLELPHPGSSNEYTEHTIILKKDIPRLYKLAPWPGSVINTQWVELPMTRTNFLFSQRSLSHWV